MHGVSESGRKYPEGRIYHPPDAELCEFFINAFPKLKETERKERMLLAKRLIEIYSGPNEKEYSQSKITAAFSWMYQAEIIDYEQAFDRSSGFRLILWRCGTMEQIEDVLTRRPSFLNGKVMKVDGGSAANPNATKVSKGKKKCCGNPRVVRKKKSGKRLCRNCGARLKERIPNE